MCNGKLLVAGPVAELRRFVEAAREKPVPGERRRRGQALNPLSFGSLLPLGDESPEGYYGTPSEEPWDVWGDEPTTVRKGLLRVVYGFQTKWAPPGYWVVHVSKRWPTLRFVLGYVEPNTDMAGSIYARAGKATEYTMGARRKAAIYAELRRRFNVKDTDDEDQDRLLEAEIEGDWKVMDCVIARWERILRGW
jgi:hypothetical protein